MVRKDTLPENVDSRGSKPSWAFLSGPQPLLMCLHQQCPLVSLNALPSFRSNAASSARPFLWTLHSPSPSQKPKSIHPTVFNSLLSTHCVPGD